MSLRPKPDERKWSGWIIFALILIFIASAVWLLLWGIAIPKGAKTAASPAVKEASSR